MCDGSKEKAPAKDCFEGISSLEYLQHKCHGHYYCNVDVTENMFDAGSDCEPLVKELKVDYICGKLIIT